MNEVTVAVVLSVDGGLAASAYWHLLDAGRGASRQIPCLCGSAKSGRPQPGMSTIARLGSHMQSRTRRRFPMIKNPFMNAYMSAANRVLNTARSHATNEFKRQSKRQTTTMVNAWVDAWTPKPSPRPRRSQRASKGS
jgi:hypothetical protein